MTVKKTWLIVGGGISGLTAAQLVQSHRGDYLLLEQFQSCGGLTRTTRVSGYSFDYTGHFLHLSRFKSPSQIPFAHLDDNEWETIDRHSYFWAANRPIRAPIQYNLGQLPPDVLKECVDSYEARPLELPRNGTFREFITSGFGQVVGERFLIPQNEKTMAISLERLSMAAVKRFFPPPDPDRIRKGIDGEEPAAAEYNSRFWYPKAGGIEPLVAGLRHGLTSVAVNEEIAQIDLDNRILQTKGGHEYAWEFMIPSIPLKSLCSMTTDAGLREAADLLSNSATISFNFGVRKEPPRELGRAHWIYVPDPAIPFYRFGCYSNINEAMCPRGHSSIYVEVGVPGNEVDRVDITGDLLPQVLSSLDSLGWIRSADIDCFTVHAIRCAYVHHTPERERVIDSIRTRLARAGVHPIGRYGLWDYTGMEDSIDSAIVTTTRLLS